MLLTVFSSHPTPYAALPGIASKTLWVTLELLTSPVSDPLLPNSHQPSTASLWALWLCLLLRFPATFLYKILLKGPEILGNSSCKVVMFLMFRFLLMYAWKLHSFLSWNKMKEIVAQVKKNQNNILGLKEAFIVLLDLEEVLLFIADQMFAAVAFLFLFSKRLPKSNQRLSSQK